MQFYALIDKVVTFTLDLVTSKVCPLELFELYKLKGIQEDYGAVTYVAKANIEHLLALHFEFMEKKEREFMNNNWIKAYNKYNWTVDLSKFNGSVEYKGFFDHVISSTNTLAFENKFRTAVNECGSFEVAGEVCFWKNYGSPQNRDKITRQVLAHLSSPINWDRFIYN
jgi:hypothetical protein